MSRRFPVPAPPPRGLLRRWPVGVWVALGVVLFHVVFFWVVANKHFLPKVRRLPPPPPVNFGAGQRTNVDPQTGEATTETMYVVSTRLASPSPKPSPTPTPQPRGE